MCGLFNVLTFQIFRKHCSRAFENFHSDFSPIAWFLRLDFKQPRNCVKFCKKKPSSCICMARVNEFKKKMKNFNHSINFNIFFFKFLNWLLNFFNLRNSIILLFVCFKHPYFWTWIDTTWPDRWRFSIPLCRRGRRRCSKNISFFWGERIKFSEFW